MHLLKHHLICFQIFYTKNTISTHGFLWNVNPLPTPSIDSVDQGFSLFLQFSDTVPQERTKISGVLLESQQLDTAASCAAPYSDGQLRMA